MSGKSQLSVSESLTDENVWENRINIVGPNLIVWVGTLFSSTKLTREICSIWTIDLFLFEKHVFKASTLTQCFLVDKTMPYLIMVHFKFSNNCGHARNIPNYYSLFPNEQKWFQTAVHLHYQFQTWEIIWYVCISPTS